MRLYFVTYAIFKVFSAFFSTLYSSRSPFFFCHRLGKWLVECFGQLYSKYNIRSRYALAYEKFNWRCEPKRGAANGDSRKIKIEVFKIQVSSDQRKKVLIITEISSNRNLLIQKIRNVLEFFGWVFEKRK